MQPKNETIKIGGLDRPLLTLYLMLVGMGVLMIYAANYKPDDAMAFMRLDNDAGKQLLFIVVCFAMSFVIMLMNWSFWRIFAFPIYIFTIILLPGTLVFGREINGANAWYHIGGFSFQPAELTKFGTCLAMAAYLSATGVSMKEWRSRITAFTIFLIPFVLIKFVQNDTGSALVFLSFFLVLYREGLPAPWYALGLGSAAMAILGLLFEPVNVVPWLIMYVNYLLIQRLRQRNTRIWWMAFISLGILTIIWSTVAEWIHHTTGWSAFSGAASGVWLLALHLAMLAALFSINYFKKNSIVQSELRGIAFLLSVASILVFAANFACYTLLAPHQQQRILVWLKPDQASPDIAYNSLHSKMAISAGGLLGKGYLQGNMTNLRYVPEQGTDFIFCTVGEEQGFLGSVAVIVFFTLLLIRIITIAERQRSNFSRNYAYCVAGVIFIHFVINIGMTMGVFPIIGIPLPFISSGGTSIIGFTLMIAVLLKLDSNRSLV
jgi:rod shape determining protein RodA